MAYLDITNNNGTRYLRVVKNVRTERDGKRVSRKRTIKNIGPISRYDDGKPDYEKRLRDSFKAGEPIIKELEPYVEKSRNIEQYNIRIMEYSPECIGHPKLFSNTFLEGVMRSLGLDDRISIVRNASKIRYKVANFFYLLVCGRILNPASKIATLSQNSDYFFPLIPDNSYDYNIYDTLSFVHKHKKALLKQINRRLTKTIRRNPKTIFYDVTNFFFEIEDADDDYEGEDGKIKKGIRQNGVSKENRKTPIVQMGLFMDDMGVPISCEMFPGNTLDHLTVRQALKSTINDMDFGRFIFIGDRGMCAYTNLLHILSQGNGYIVSKSLAKSSKKERDWAYDDNGYINVSDNFKYKSRIAVRHIKNEDGEDIKITEKVVVYWDRYFYNRQVAENQKFLDFLKKLQDNPNNFRVTALEAKCLKPFFKKEYKNIKTGELINSAKLRAVLDDEKIKHATDKYGYYQIITSELEMNENEVINAYHGLTRIEDQFRIMKGVLNTRPLFVRTPEHIDAHLTICTIALIIIRLIQLKILEYKPELASGGKDWSFGMSAERIQKALNKWTVDQISDEYYRFNNIDDPDLKLILEAFEIDIPTKLFLRQELRSIKRKISIPTRQ